MSRRLSRKVSCANAMQRNWSRQALEGLNVTITLIALRRICGTLFIGRWSIVLSKYEPMNA